MVLHQQRKHFEQIKKTANLHSSGTGPGDVSEKQLDDQQKKNASKKKTDWGGNIQSLGENK